MACGACWYVLARDDIRPAHDLARSLHQQWRDRLGDDHEHVQTIAVHLGHANRLMRRYAEARDLDQDILDCYRRILGADHPDTLASATTLARDLHALGEMDDAS
jgi:Tetratricopeptide repeat